MASKVGNLFNSLARGLLRHAYTILDSVVDCISKDVECSTEILISLDAVDCRCCLIACLSKLMTRSKAAKIAFADTWVFDYSVMDSSLREISLASSNNPCLLTSF